MTEYFITVMAVTLAGGVIISIAPKDSSVRYIKLLCGLCTVCCVAFPLISFVGNGFDTEGLLKLFDYDAVEQAYYEEIYNNNFDKLSIENAEIKLKSEIIKEISAKDEDFDVKIITETSSGEIYISSVRVTIYKSGLSIDPKLIENFIFDSLGCQTVFFYDI